MLRIERITDIIAADEWRHGARVSRIEISRPQPAPDDPNGDWYCAVFVQGFTDGIVPAYGVGPIDALMNAVMLVRIASIAGFIHAAQHEEHDRF
jgi:hypothetical protein